MLLHAHTDLMLPHTLALHTPPAIVHMEAFVAEGAYVYRVEWQARGLPHAHMMLDKRDGACVRV